MDIEGDRLNHQNSFQFHNSKNKINIPKNQIPKENIFAWMLQDTVNCFLFPFLADFRRDLTKKIDKK